MARGPSPPPVVLGAAGTLSTPCLRAAPTTPVLEPPSIPPSPWDPTASPPPWPPLTLFASRTSRCSW